MTSETAAQLAAQFAHYVVPTLMPVAVRVVRIAAIEPRDTVLDLGTTTGLGAFLAAAQAGREAAVVGVDTSAAMLAIAERRSRLAGARQVRWHVGDAAALDLADESFDAALCIHLLHDLARPAEALAEVQRVLAPGGRLALAVWGSAAAGLVRMRSRSAAPAQSKSSSNTPDSWPSRASACATSYAGATQRVCGGGIRRGRTWARRYGTCRRRPKPAFNGSSPASPRRIETGMGWPSRARWSTRGRSCRRIDGSRALAGCLYCVRGSRR